MILSNIFKGRLFSTESTHANWAKAGNYLLDFFGLHRKTLRLKYSRLGEMFIHIVGHLSDVKHVLLEELS